MSLDRRGRAWIGGGVVFVVLLAIAGIVREIISERYDPFGIDSPDFEVPFAETERAIAVLIDEGDWIFERAQYQDGSPCVRIRIEDRTTTCSTTEFMSGGSAMGVFHAPDGRNFVQLVGGQSYASALLFTSDRIGEPIPSIAIDETGSVNAVVVELAVGEEPWGLQVFDSDGNLIGARSLLGMVD